MASSETVTSIGVPTTAVRQPVQQVRAPFGEVGDARGQAAFGVGRSVAARQQQRVAVAEGDVEVFGQAPRE
jgi:hypothetical protein